MEFDTSFDYLTVTLKCPTEWEQSIERIFRTVSIDGKRRPWSFLKYQGYSIATMDGHLSWGKGHSGGIIQSGGEVANVLAARAIKWVPKEMRVTRLDLALTFNLEGPAQLVRQLAVNQERDWRTILPTEDKGGGTLYVGSRTSDSFGRLYDKGALLNRDLPKSIQVRPAHLWRAEVEYKAERARSAWVLAMANNTYDAKRTWIADTVLSWFQNRGVPLPIMPTSPSVVSVSTRGVDDIRTIKWFYEQVRPALLRLAESGKEQDALDALGVEHGSVYKGEFNFVGDGALQFSFFDNGRD